LQGGESDVSLVRAHSSEATGRLVSYFRRIEQSAGCPLSVRPTISAAAAATAAAALPEVFVGLAQTFRGVEVLQRWGQSNRPPLRAVA